MNINEISNALITLSPAKRVKYLRQKLLKQNQHSFCEDGIIRSGTLKSIESERMKIGSKVAERLVHKFHLEGIICGPHIFLEHGDPCDIKIDHSKKELSGSAMSSLEEIRKKTALLTPIVINTNDYAPIIPEHSTLLGREATKNDVVHFKNTLCFIKGDKSSLYYLTHLNNEELEATFNNKTINISANIFDFCSIFIIEIVYFGNQ